MQSLQKFNMERMALNLTVVMTGRTRVMRVQLPECLISKDSDAGVLYFNKSMIY